MSVTCVTNEVTDVLIKEGSTAILEGSEVSFFYKVEVGIFVLWNDLRDAEDIAINNLEIKRSGQ